jgi:hypothetical protein
MVAGGFAAAGAALTLLVSGCGSLTTSGENAERETHTIEEGFHVGLLLPELQTARYEAFDKPFFEEALAELCPNCELSYANADQDVDEQQTQAQAMLTEGVDVLVLDAVDSLLLEHPELGLSTYDRHSDGSGVCYSSRLRPATNVKPFGRHWNFNLDLFIIDWLEHLATGYDVITDEDLHDEGLDLLRPYNVVITGSHP